MWLLTGNPCAFACFCGCRQELFEILDADGEMSLDINEMSPFYIYTFAHVFGAVLDRTECEAIFHLMDSNCDSELSFQVTAEPWELRPCLFSPLAPRCAPPPPPPLSCIG